jgi:thiol-disulfide isomerase/thioredoxin
MVQFKSIALGVSAFCLLFASGCGPMPPQDALMDKPAPDFEVQSLQSNMLSKTLVSCKGSPVILDFWETTCGPCRMLNPHIEKVYEEFKDKGLEAMAISDEPREQVRKFEDRGPHEIPVYVDQNDLAVGAYGVTGFPTVVVVDRKGNVVFHQVGFPPNMEYDLEVALRKVVEKAVKEPA